MRPTLIIGLGGTGTRVAGTVYRYLKRDSQLSQEAEENIKIFAFDTKKYPESAEVQNFVAMQGFDGAQVVENMLMDENNDISKWWYKGYRPGFIADGAGQVRINGRLALVYNLSQNRSIYHLLNRAITNIAQLFTMRGAEAHKVIDVFIISSIAGGTGSGMIIDVARLSRKIIKLANFNPRIVGVLLDPRIVEGVVSVALHRRIEANGYATLQEIEYWMHPQRVREDMFRIKYNKSINIGYDKGDEIALKNDRLFEYILYVADQNEDGRFMDSLDSYIALVGQGIYLMSVSELAAAEQSTLDNIINHCEALQDRKGRSRFFGSFGISMLSFPRERVLLYCSRLLGTDVLERVLNAQIDLEEVRSSVSEFMASNRIRELNADEVIDDLKKQREGYSVPSWNVQKAIMNADEAWQTEVIKAKKILDDILSKFIQLVEANYHDKLNEVKANLNAKVSEYTYKKGIRFASAFIESLIAEIKVHYQDIENERKKILPNIEKGRFSEKHGVSIENKIADAHKSFFLSRKKKIAQAAELYARWWRGRLETLKSLKLREYVEEFYSELIQYLKNLHEILDYIGKDIVEPIKEEFQSGVDLFETVDRGGRKNLESQYVVEINVLADKTTVHKKIYENSRPQKIEEIARKFVQGEGEVGIWPIFKQVLETYGGDTESMSRLREKSVVRSYREAVEGYLRNLSTEPFEKFLEEMNISRALVLEATALLEDNREKELRYIIGDQELERIKQTYGNRPSNDPELVNEVVALRIANAIQRSAPFWTISDRAEIGSELNELLLMGYETSLAPELEKTITRSLEIQRISTWSKVLLGDPDQLLIFRASYGAPFDLLKGVEEKFRNSYEFIKEQTSNIKPLHTDRRYERLITDIRLHYYLALAEEFGIVISPDDQKKGVFVLSGIKEKAIPDKEIGEGRERVLFVLSDEHPEYLLELQDRVDEKLRELNPLQILKLYESVRDRLFELSEKFKADRKLYELLLKEAKIFADYALNYREENKETIKILEKEEKQ